jgi:hypothetical protein
LDRRIGPDGRSPRYRRRRNPRLRPAASRTGSLSFSSGRTPVLFQDAHPQDTLSTRSMAHDRNLLAPKNKIGEGESAYMSHVNMISPE